MRIGAFNAELVPRDEQMFSNPGSPRSRSMRQPGLRVSRDAR